MPRYAKSPTTLSKDALKAFLEEKAVQYNGPEFLETDPVQIPHRFTLKQDIEIAGFLTATIAWGNRRIIIRNSERIVALMDEAPYDFILNHQPKDRKRFDDFVHRTFNGADLRYFATSLQDLYRKEASLERLFMARPGESRLQAAITRFRSRFFEGYHPIRTQKHVSDPSKGSAAKRLNMFLRWMVRQDNSGVDFGIWPAISPSQLSCPLDVHSGNVARKLGLLHRRQNDAKALVELDQALRELDPKDPVKFDYALFGLGVFEGF